MTKTKNTLNQYLKAPCHFSSRATYIVVPNIVSSKSSPLRTACVCRPKFQNLCNFSCHTCKCSTIYTKNTKVFFLDDVIDVWWSDLRLKLVLVCLASPLIKLQSHSRSFNWCHILSFNKYKVVRTLWIRCHFWHQTNLVLDTSIFIKTVSAGDCQTRLKSHSPDQEMRTLICHASC